MCNLTDYPSGTGKGEYYKIKIIIKKMNIKPILLILLVAFFLNNFSSAQIAGTTFRNRISGKPVYNKSTGELISNEEFGRIVKLNPNIALEHVINKYGEIESFIYDPEKKDNIRRIDTTKRIKPGEQFPPFVMNSLKNEIIDSDKLLGRVVVIQFYAYFLDPFLKRATIDDFETLMQELDDKKDMVFITVTKSNIEEIQERIDISDFNSKIVSDGRNFFERYFINDIRAFTLIDKFGRLVSYYDNKDFDQLKIDLMNVE